MFRSTAIAAVVVVGSMFATQETARADFRIGIHTPNVDVRFGSGPRYGSYPGGYGLGGHYHGGNYHAVPSYRPAPIYVPSYYTPAPVVVPQVVLPIAQTFTVEYRAPGHLHWHYYATTGSHGEAHNLERHLERSGYIARVRH